MTSTETRRAIGYTRTSTDEQHIRLEDDEARIRKWCDLYDHELVEMVKDPDTSGKVPLAERPEGRRVADLIDAKRPWAEVLVITNLDRLSRDANDGIPLIKRMVPSNGRKRHHVALVSIDQHLDFSGPFGVYMAQQFILFGELERAMIGWRTSNALQHKRRTGQVYGRTPFGFDRAGDHLVPNDAEQAVIAGIREARSQGVTDHAIACDLNARGVPTKRGGRWQANTVWRIMRRVELDDLEGAPT